MTRAAEQKLSDEERFHRLDMAYCEDNLTRISSRLIRAYRENERIYLRRIARLAGVSVRESGIQSNRLFAALITRYHPDRLEGYRQSLRRWQKGADPSALSSLEHILRVEQMVSAAIDPIDLSDGLEPVIVRTEYVVDEEELADLGIRMDTETDGQQRDETETGDLSNFMEVLLYEEFGSLDVAVEEVDLANLTGILDLSDTGLTSLEGIVYCKGLAGVNLSGNQLLEATELGFLRHLEEIDLSNNQIDAVDWCETLSQLRWLDLSFNQISDISALLDLRRLEYVNLVGNPLLPDQIRALRDKNVLVISD